MSNDTDGRELWEIQKAFNDKFFATKGGWPKEDQLTNSSKDFAIHLIKEATEVLDELSFKMHRTGKESIDRNNVLEELVDVQKFLWGWMQIWGVSWEEFGHEFRRKSMVVEQRFAQEQSLPALATATCCIVDIDGVLADYPAGFYEFCISNFYQQHSIVEFAQLYADLTLLKREALKAAYRKSGVKANLRVIPGAKQFLDAVRRHSNGYLKIILMTNRPYSTYYRIYPDTLEWLAKNDLVYDGIIWAEDKGIEAVKKFKNIMWAVDDNPKNVTRLREARITTIKIDNDDPERSTMALYKLAEGINKIEDLGFAWNRKLVETSL